MAAETWFDTRTGDLLIGQAAATDRLDEAGPDIRPFRDVLLDEPFQYDATDFEKPRRSYSRDELIDHCHWVMGVVNAAENEPSIPLSTKLIKRAGYLGIGASLASYKRRGLTIECLVEELGERPLYSPRGQFDDYTIPDFVAHAQKVSAYVGGRRPREYDYNDYARQYAGSPTLKVIRKRGLTVGNINEHIGFPNSRTMDESDLVRFGAKVATVNGISMLKYDTITVLSLRDRSPSYAFIVRTFGSWQKYILRVEEHLQQERAATEHKLILYNDMISGGQLPAAYVDLSDSQLLQRAAGYRLLDNWPAMRALPDKEKQKVADKVGRRAYVATILKYNPRICAADIEIAAELQGIQDDIWPPADPSPYLLVDPREFIPIREKSRERLREFRRQRRAA